VKKGTQAEKHVLKTPITLYAKNVEYMEETVPNINFH
jgi:hypothetical protein